MATKRAGAIVINLSAGTSQFVQDMERAKAKVRDFGSSARGMGSDLQHGVSAVQATSGALRVLEGGITNNLRAAERFTANVLGLGPILQAAFPVVGAIAFLGILSKLGEEGYKFYKGMEQAPGKADQAFRELNSSLRVVNDGLEVANARLEADIAKLEGRRENGLKIALLEAKEAADKLAESLEKDLTSLQKVLKENDASFMQKLFGRSGNETFQTALFGPDGYSGFFKQVESLNEKFATQLASAKNDSEKNSALKDWSDAIAAAYDRQIAAIQKLQTELGKKSGSLTGTRDLQGNLLPDENRPEMLATARAVQGNLQGQRTNALESIQSTVLTGRKDALTASAANAELDRPFEDRIKSINAQIEGVRTKMASIGQGEAGEALAKGFAEGFKAVEEVNKALEKHHAALQAGQNLELIYKNIELANAEAEATWKTKLDSTTDSIQNRIGSLRLLTAAIGQGYEATKRASVETNVMGAVGKNYGDKEWMQSHQSDIEGLRSKYGTEFDSQHTEETAKTLNTLSQQIDLERALAKAQSDGAEAVRQVTLAQKLRQIALDNDAESAKKLMAAEIAQYQAERANVSAEAEAKLNEETAATQRLTAAVWEGAEAARQAALENKYSQMRHEGVAPEVIQATQSQDEAKHQEEVTTEAAKMANSYSDALARVSQLTEKLKEQRDTQGDTLGIEISLRDLENQRLKLWAEMSLQMGRAQDGVHAFFLDMERSAENAAQIIYDAMHSALDKSSEELANLMTGKKTNFGKDLQEIGHKMVASSMKSLLQMTLGTAGGGKADGSQSNPFHVVMAGGLPGPDPGYWNRQGLGLPGSSEGGEGGPSVWQRILGLGRQKQHPITFGNGGVLGTGQVPGGGKTADGSPSNPMSVILAPNAGGPDGTEGNPFYVVESQEGGGFQNKPIDFGQIQAKPPAPPNGLQEAGGLISGIAGLLGGFGGFGGLFGGGGGGGGGTPEVQSTVSYPGMASGGPVKGGMQYLVGERGPELFRSATAGHIIDHETTKRLARAGLLPALKVLGATAAPKRLTPRADGGDVRPGDAYMVGERGPETFLPGQVMQTEVSRRTAAQIGDTNYYTIDARGTDPMLVEQRVKAAILQSRNSAISSSVQATVERGKRTPAVTPGS